ncbi:MAG: DsbA family protein [Anaerolineales bacterium]|nr:DsbA family protein [Anaerolineales bacterium]
MKGKKTSQTKREAIRERRRKAQKQKRLMLFLIIIGIALLVTALLIVPNLDIFNPETEVIQITPIDRPMVDGSSIGDATASVILEVFSDFQCTACREFARSVEPLLIQNHISTGQVLLIYRQYPFLDDRNPGNESKQAANASLCAAEQDRFWDYHDILFANLTGVNVGSFTDRKLIAFAETLGFDMDLFESCFRENRYRSVIDQDIALGRERNVTGTPSVFINGEIVRPGFVPSYQDLQEAINAALATPGQ